MTVESLLLLAGFLAQERQRRAVQARDCAAAAAMWNEFAEKNGWFADEYSTL
ncbi:MAG: type II toxin-antitoxin system CcdA family antitoxin [Steroidobacteraceae bacterium]